MYRGAGSSLKLLLVHPGGPLWVKKDAGAWSIPKGEYLSNEDPLAGARREFAEEVGAPAPKGPYLELGELMQPSRKRVVAFAVAGEFDPATLKSSLFEMMWPPRSGQVQTFSEVDRAAWFSPEEARIKILPGQAPFIDRLREKLAG
jgi:predicted NUDIX family NTP pyrophosphohydrolase